jgi:hypothetical protein
MHPITMPSRQTLLQLEDKVMELTDKLQDVQRETQARQAQGHLLAIWRDIEWIVLVDMFPILQHHA